jgi:Predicted nucleotide-binding protein containing TIR -like domain
MPRTSEIVKPTIFISSSSEDLATARELARQLQDDARINLWSEGVFSIGKTIAELLSQSVGRADFAVFLLGEDDLLVSPSGHTSLRANLMFELGFAAGQLGLNRTLVVLDERSDISLPSDLAGASVVLLRRNTRTKRKHGINSVAEFIRERIAQVQPRLDKPRDYYSCFLSYSWSDKEFATQLHADLKSIGVRCWLDEKELRPGDNILEQVDRALDARDKILLVVSAAALKSQWVKREIDHALKVEQARHSTILFPLAVDSAAFERAADSTLRRVQGKLMLDFREWRSAPEYRREFKRLAQALAITASSEAGARD